MDDGGYHAWQQEQKLKQVETALTFIAEEYEKLKAENERLRKDLDDLSDKHKMLMLDMEIYNHRAEWYKTIRAFWIDCPEGDFHDYQRSTFADEGACRDITDAIEAMKGGER